MKIKLEDLKLPWRDLYRQCRSAFWTFNRWLLLHPTLLIPLAAAYVFATLIAVALAAGIAIGITLLAQKVFGFGEDVFNGVATLLLELCFVVLFLAVWLHYLYLVVRSVLSAAALQKSVLPIFRVAQLVVVLIFIFAVAHYYVALFSDVVAYHGIDPPRPELGWRDGGFAEKLMYIPSATTIIDFIYFSTVTTATIGYGDVAPSSIPAKILTIIQIIFSFGLIAIVLGWVIGKVSAKS